MKLSFAFLLQLCCLVYAANAQTLGNYSTSFVDVGHNLNITPTAAPTNTTRITVTSSTKFLGILTGNPTTGVVSITNAKPVGVYSIKVRAFNSSGSSITKTFNISVRKPGCSQGEFTGNGSVSSGLNQVNVVIGDFNRDGKQDLACVHEGGNNTLSIRLGDGSGGFTGTSEIPVGSHPFSAAIDDFDRDGKQDIVITNSGDNSITPLLGNGNGGFSIQPVKDVGNTPLSCTTGDFNGDYFPDILTGNYNSHDVSIRFGDGVGGFYGLTQYPVGHFPRSIAVGDFNNDGKLDFATANSGDNTVSIRLGTGTGGFTGNTEVPVGSDPYCVAVADLNGDGNQDIATANHLSNTISVRYGDGTGGFSGNMEIPAGNGPHFVAIGNINGDNFKDLVTANYFSNNITVSLGDGAGGFIGNISSPTASYPTGLALGEFNNDNLMDVAVSSYGTASISIRLGVTGPAVVGMIQNTTPVCEGEPFELDAPYAISYLWSGPHGFTSTDRNVIIANPTISDTGIYQLTITDSTGCTGTASTFAIIHPLPNVSLNLMVDSLCLGDPAVLLAGGIPLNGNYSGIGVTNGSVFNPSLSGPGGFTITYSYTDNNDCVSEDTAKMTVLICEGIPDFTQKTFSVYPNPFSNNLNVSWDQITGDRQVFLLTSEGRLVKEWSMGDVPTSSFETGDLSKGIYFLKVITKNLTQLVRIHKQD